MHNKYMLIVMGPTGVGKTRLSIDLARHFGTEIISADSRQMYREMKIGTAVPNDGELDCVPHHFIGNLSIHDYYNASMYENEVIQRSVELFKKYSLLIMVGGSGLYIDAVCNGIDDLPSIDEGVRSRLKQRLEDEGLEALCGELKKRDPEHYRKVDLNNAKRVLKALEISIMTGRPYSSFLTRQKKQRDFHIIKAGIQLEREALYHRINERVDRMIREGLFDEARSLFPYRHLNALNTVGYKELFRYFEGSIDRAEAIRLIKRNTRHYARRQMTWFGRDNEITWFRPDEREKIIAFMEAQTKVS